MAKTVADLHLERNSAVLLLRNELDLLSDSDEEEAPMPLPTRVRASHNALDPPIATCWTRQSDQINCSIVASILQPELYAADVQTAC